MGSFMSHLFVEVSDLPHNVYGFIQLMFLGFVYGQILMKGSNLIKDGSELLLLIPSLAGVVGSIVLPVLGAVPDGAIVIFSGLGPDAQTQVAVGVGALAGSTVMLLTVPWVLCLIGGRVNILPNGTLNYTRPKGATNFKKLDPENRFAGTGCKVGTSIGYSAKIMLLTLVSFLIVQIPALAKNCSELHHAPADEPSSIGSAYECQSPPIAALIGGIVATLLFAFYLWDQARLANEDPVKEAIIDELRHKALDSGLVNLRGLFPEKIMDVEGNIPLKKDNKRFQNFLRPYFRRFDTDNSGFIEAEELHKLLVALGEAPPSKERIKEVMQQIDTDNSGNISLEEFAGIVVAALEMSAEVSKVPSAVDSPSDLVRTADVNEGGAEGGDDEEGDEEEDAEMPEDLAALSPEEQQRKVLLRACWQMGLGVALVLFFSDPMVDVFSEVGVRLGIKPFFVAFVLAPLASNASELIAAYAYALKKTEKTMTISLSSLIGAACMNNTFCLALFLFLVYFKELKWVFTAETACIVIIEVIMFFIARIRLQKVWFALVVGSLFPLGICIVAALEAAGLD